MTQWWFIVIYRKCFFIAGKKYKCEDDFARSTALHWFSEDFQRGELIIWKPANWFAKQINWLVSIWYGGLTKENQKRKARQLWNEVKSNSEYLANTIRQLKTKAAERKGVIHVFLKSNPIFRLRPYLLRVIHNFNPQVA